MDKTEAQEVKSCTKCGAKKQNTNEEKKCSKCKKAQQNILPILIVSLVFFGFAIYGIVTFVKDMIVLFSK
jgi:hypothetical protein